MATMAVFGKIPTRPRSGNRRRVINSPNVFPLEGASSSLKSFPPFAWSPDGGIVASTFNDPSFRIILWKPTTGEKIATLVLPPNCVGMGFLSPVFSSDGSKVASAFEKGDQFAVWSVPDGRSVPDGLPPIFFQPCTPDADGVGAENMAKLSFGVPGSASNGLMGFASGDFMSVNLQGIEGNNTAVQRINIGPFPPECDGSHFATDFSFSPTNGNYFVVAFSHLDEAKYCRDVMVFDVKTRACISIIRPPHSKSKKATWTPDGLRVLVSWKGPTNTALKSTQHCMYLWDFTNNEMGVTARVTISSRDRFIGWSPTGASYFVLEKANNEVPTTFSVVELATSDNHFVFAGHFLWTLTPPHRLFPEVSLSPNARTVALPPCPGFPARIMTF